MSVGSHLGIAYPGPGNFMLCPASKDAESPSNLCILYSAFCAEGVGGPSNVYAKKGHFGTLLDKYLVSCN